MLKKVTAVSLALLAGTAGLLVAGPLSPPAGPVASTYKTLGEVEPRIAINATNTPANAIGVYNISQPGSYYLTGDVVGVAGKSGIVIAASNVRVDLNGFTVRGVSGSFTGIANSSSASMYEVCNGSVIGWGASGVNFRPYAPSGSVVRNIHAAYNGGAGIEVAAESRVIDCIARQNIGVGISSFSKSQILNCQAIDNGDDGISFGASCSVDRCLSVSNDGEGFWAGETANITNCTARDNTGNGFEINTGSRVTNCVSYSNNAYGFFVWRGVRITECTSEDNATSAVRVTSMNAEISRCTLSGVAGFPVVIIDNVAGVRVEGNTISNGTSAVSGPGAISALVIGNQCIAQSGVPFALGATCQIGPVINTVGNISTTSPFANFVR